MMNENITHEICLQMQTLFIRHPNGLTMLEQKGVAM